MYREIYRLKIDFSSRYACKNVWKKKKKKKNSDTPYLAGIIKKNYYITVLHELLFLTVIDGCRGNAWNYSCEMNDKRI